jgi:acyl dehydratase
MQKQSLQEAFTKTSNIEVQARAKDPNPTHCSPKAAVEKIFSAVK